MCCFGCGNSLYEEEYYNKVGKDLNNYLLKLNGNILYDITLGDNNISRTKNGDIDSDFDIWINNIKNLFKINYNITKKNKSDNKKNKVISCV